jgi:hypothetical protein
MKRILYVLAIIMMSNFLAPNTFAAAPQPGTTTETRKLGTLEILGAKTAAKKYLDNLRDGSTLYGLDILFLRDSLRKGGLSLADIGTSEAELKKFEAAGIKGDARKQLKDLRDGSLLYEVSVFLLIHALEKGNLSLADIGTNDVELTKLYKLGAKTQAKKYLKDLRDGSTFYALDISFLRDALRKGGLTLADIGTSEAEIGKLK